MRSDSINEIGCWFIDSNHDDESSFVRDSCFTGANDPYKRLRQSLKADIDRDAWESLYPHTPPQLRASGISRIAVKVIDHHGDEVLKTYDVP